MSRLAVAAVVGVAIAGCASSDRVEQCTDSLAGQWTAADGAKAPSGEVRAYDFIEHDNHRLEVHAAFDDSVPPDGAGKTSSEVIYAPGSFALGRVDRGLAGQRMQRWTRDGVICTTKLPAKATCAGGAIELSWQVVESIDWTDCAVVAAAQWQRVTLKR